MTRHNIEQIVFLVLVMLFFAWAGWDSLSFPEKAQTYPRTVAFAAVLIALAELGSYIWSVRAQKLVPSKEGSDGVTQAETLSAKFMQILPYLLWLLACYAAIYVIGMVVASGLFVFLFLLREGKVTWYYALLSGLIVTLFLVAIGDVMGLKWPNSVIDPLALLGLG